MSTETEVQEEQKEEPKHFPESYVKELRDEAKSNRLKAKELEDKLKAIEEAEAIQKGQLNEVLQKVKTEKAELENQLNEVLPFRDKYTALEQVRREELISFLPEGKHKDFAAKITNIEDLKEYVDLNKEVKSKSDDGKSGYQGNDIPKDAKFNDLTLEQKRHLKNTNPQWYNKLASTSQG